MGKSKESVEDLRERARTEFNITNADEMDEKQLRAEVKAIEDQPATADTEDAGVPSNQQPAAAQNSAGSVPQTPATGNSDEDEEDDEDEDEDESPSFSTRNSRDELEAEASRLGVNNPDDREQFPNKPSLLEAIEERQ